MLFKRIKGICYVVDINFSISSFKYEHSYLYFLKGYSDL